MFSTEAKKANNLHYYRKLAFWQLTFSKKMLNQYAERQKLVAITTKQNLKLLLVNATEFRSR